MANEATTWDAIPLDELTEKETPITYGVVKPGEEGDVPFVRGGDIAGGRVLMDQLRTIGHDVSQQYRRTLLRGGEILVSLVGNPGQIAIAPPSLAGANIARQVGLVRLKPGIDTRFVSYFLQSHEGQTSLGAQSLGSVQQVINLRDLKTVKVPLPPLAEQKAIAAVLGALDDKIELNRRMNATLEAMARALFQSWFVDFDPVRAKLDGRQPTGLDAATAALFPSAFQESDLGPIPKGWTAGKLGDIASNPRRGVQPDEIKANTPYIALEHMPRRCIALGEWADSADVASGKSAFKKGEVLFGKLRPYFHKVGVAPIDGVCSTDILVLAPKSPEWFGFLLGHASSDELIQFTDLASTGTKMPRTNWGDVSSFKVAISPVPVAAAFTRFMEPLLEHIHANLHQSRTLATLRDTLLPKLLSGALSGNRFQPK